MGANVIARRLPWVFWALTTGLVAVTVFLIVVNGPVDVGLEPETPAQRWMHPVFAGVWVKGRR